MQREKGYLESMVKQESSGSEENSIIKDQSSLRQSNIELLRIIAMVLIVMHHYVTHGTTNFVYLDPPLSAQNVLALFFGAFGRPAVGIFVLICGYFSIKSEFKLPRFVSLVAQVLSYSVILLLIARFILPGGSAIGRDDILASIFPTSYGTYWFFTSYAVLLLLSPYINQLLLKLTQKQHKSLILLVAVIWCVLPTLIGASFAGSDLAYFVSFYLIAAYFRRIKKVDRQPPDVIPVRGDHADEKHQRYQQLCHGVQPVHGRVLLRQLRQRKKRVHPLRNLLHAAPVAEPNPVRQSSLFSTTQQVCAPFQLLRVRTRRVLFLCA